MVPPEPIREAAAAPAAIDPKPEQSTPTVLAAISADKTPAEPAAAASQAIATTPAAPVEAMTEKSDAASTDTLKADDKTIDTTPTRIAALTEPAADQGLTEAKPLSPKEVKIPQPRIDPAIREAHRRKLLEQQRARARVAQARRLAAARARNAAQARANAAATSNPFALPQATGSN